MSNERKIPVKNRSSGRVGYKIDSLRVYRSWPKPNDVLFIPIDELIELKVGVPGGKKLLEGYLLIEDVEALSLIFDNEVEPEYKYTEKEISFLLYEGTDEQFLDCLDYSPVGVLDLVKSMAIQKQPNTTAKLDAINKKFNVNLARLIENAKDSVLTEESIVENKRRTLPITVEPTVSKYKVINK